jgi:hypothetical protein
MKLEGKLVLSYPRLEILLESLFTSHDHVIYISLPCLSN